MDFNSLITLFKRGILEPEQLWQEERSRNYLLADFLKSKALPLIIVTTLLATLGILLFGYRVPFTDIVMHPTFRETIMAFISSIVMFLVSITIFGWLSSYIVSLLGGKFDFTNGVVMMVLVSIPSMVGKIFGTIPYIGMIIAIIASIYSLILLYRAPTIMLDLPAENRTKAIILFILASIVVSILLSLTLGQIFKPSTIPLPQG